MPRSRRPTSDPAASVVPGADHRTGAAEADAGFTLIEVMISTALFGLIALAGFALLDSELKVRARTDGRLERLGDLQRALYVMTADFEQMSAGDLSVAEKGVSFQRHATGSGTVTVRYDLQGETLRRRLGANPAAQSLVGGVSALHWRFYDPVKGWLEAWPAPGAPAGARPAAVSIDLTLDGESGAPAGVLRRLVALPAQP